MRRIRGSGTVYKEKGRRNNPYRAIGWYEDKKGNPKKKHLGYFPTKIKGKEALELFNLNKEDYKETPKVGKIYEKILDDKIRLGRADSTIRGLEFAWTFLCRFQEDFISDIRARHLEETIKEMQEDSLSYSSQYQVRSLMSQIYTEALKDDYVKQNYAQLVEIDKEPEPDNRTFSKEDRSLIFKEAEENDWAKIIMIQIYTCLRPTELLTANKYKVRLGKDPYFIAGIKTEAGRDRVIPIHPKILNYVKYFLSISECEFLISEKGKRILYRRYLEKYTEVINRLGIEYLSPHKCRKTGATMYLDAGMRPEDLQRLLGHADYNTTVKYYFNPEDNHIKQAILMAD